MAYFITDTKTDLVQKLSNEYSNEDVLVEIGSIVECNRYREIEKQLRPVKYDVSSFLRDYNAMGNEWHSKLERFIQKLDKKVRIDINAEIHKSVVNGIDLMVNTICEELCTKGYPIDRILKSGSFYAGLRVGLPYEADILLEVKLNKEIDDDFVKTYSKTICEIANAIAIEDWIIYSAGIHGVGTCLKLIYNDKSHGMKHVGVLLDLIPCCALKDKIQTGELTEQAQQYLGSKYNDVDLCKYKVTHLLKDVDFDTGYLEHQILKQLPENIKAGYGIAKYLLQSELVRSVPLVATKTTGNFDISYGTLTKLFGYKSIVPSHILQVFLLQLLVKTHGTTIEDELTGSKLTLCLLDMLYHTAQQFLDEWTPYRDSGFMDNQMLLSVEDTLVRDRSEAFNITVVGPTTGVWNLSLMKALQLLSCELMKHAYLGDVALEYHHLLNDIDNCSFILLRFYDMVEETFQSKYPETAKLCFYGFSRGPRPEQMAEAHDCDKRVCRRPSRDHSVFNLYQTRSSPVSHTKTFQCVQWCLRFMARLAAFCRNKLEYFVSLCFSLLRFIAIQYRRKL